MEDQELALEIINLKIAKEIKENKEKDFKKFKENILKLKDERKDIYSGDKRTIEKVIKEYLQ